MASNHFDEEDNSLVFAQILTYRKTVGDLGHLLDHVVYLGGANSHSRDFDHRVRSAIEGESPRFAVHYHIVSMSPHVLPFQPVIFEVGFSVSLVSGIVPKVEGHGWSWGLTDQLAHYVNNWPTIFIVYIDFHSKSWGLQLARINWKDRHSSGKAAVYVGAS